MTAMNKRDFTEFLINTIKTAMPNAGVSVIDDLNIDVQLNEDMGMKVYFGNVWENYQRTNDINLAIQFVQTQINIMKQKDSLEGNNIDMSQIFPTFRGTGYGKKLHEGKEVLMIADEFSSELEVLYVLDNPQYISFLTESNLPDGVTTDNVSDIAFENLKKQGWIEPDESLDLGPIASLHVFHEQNKQFHAQFMVREMYESHLGNHFYFSFPSREVAVVLQFKDSPENHPAMSLEYMKRLKLMTIHMYHSLQNPLSNVIHRMYTGEGVAVMG